MWTPICIDNNTSKSNFYQSFDHYARILVDVYLSGQLHDKMLVERTGYSLYVDIDSEKLPSFGNVTENVRHSINEYNKAKIYRDTKEDKNAKARIKRVP